MFPFLWRKQIIQLTDPALFSGLGCQTALNSPGVFKAVLTHSLMLQQRLNQSSLIFKSVLCRRGFTPAKNEFKYKVNYNTPGTSLSRLCQGAPLCLFPRPSRKAAEEMLTRSSKRGHKHPWKSRHFLMGVGFFPRFPIGFVQGCCTTMHDTNSILVRYFKGKKL